MKFLISDTFTGSLAKLTAEEQKQVKTAAFDLQMDPASPGMKFHKVDRARDKDFWSVRVGSDLRLIVHRTNENLLLCYVDHHDDAYAWAERRKLTAHPATGAAQLVEIRETIGENFVHRRAQINGKDARQALFASLPDKELLGYGVPPEWLSDVKNADEDSLLDLAAHLPGEAAEALLELATGGKPRYRSAVAPGKSFEHPDVERRFRLVGSAAELEQALSYPWEKWTVFLHPDQRALVEQAAGGPMRISGSAGTGKTIVALHRAVSLARRYPEARVLLTTFSDVLANALRNQLSRLISDRHEPRLMERIDVRSMDGLGRDLYTARWSSAPRVAAEKDVRSILTEAMREIEGHKFKLPFLMSEWEDVIDAWRLETWEAYRDFRRLGRKTRLSEQQRSLLWQIFERAEKRLAERGLMTSSMFFGCLRDDVAQRRNILYDFIVVDEAQDIGVAQLRFLAALGAHRPDALFFTGDLGQRIFQQPFSWKDLGVDIRGRSHTLRVNYRTSHQIRVHADRLLMPEISDIDGNAEKRNDTISIFNGPVPMITAAKDEEQEKETVYSWISARLEEGVMPHEIGIFVRGEAQFVRAENVVKKLSVPDIILDEKMFTHENTLSVGTMHKAKGLEFKAVVVMACDSDVIPLEERMKNAGDAAEMEEIYNTERHLLYVACTRARDHLLLTGVIPTSEFLDDLGVADQ